MRTVNLPKKVYFKDGSMGVALRELAEVYHLKSALIVTSAATYVGGAGTTVMRYLESIGLRTSELFVNESAVTVCELKQARTVLQEFEPEAIVAVGGVSAMSAAKVIGILANNPDIDPGDISAIEEASGGKVITVMIPTEFATGAQSTAFAEIDDGAGIKVIRSLSLIPEMTVTDAQFIYGLCPDKIKADAAILLAKAVEAILDDECNGYLEGFLGEAISSIIKYRDYAADGCPKALEKLHNAGTIAGNAFSNICEGYDPGKKIALPAKGELSEDKLCKLEKIIDMYDIPSVDIVLA